MYVLPPSISTQAKLSFSFSIFSLPSPSLSFTILMFRNKQGSPRPGQGRGKGACETKRDGDRRSTAAATVEKVTLDAVAELRGVMSDVHNRIPSLPPSLSRPPSAPCGRRADCFGKGSDRNVYCTEYCTYGTCCTLLWWMWMYYFSRKGIGCWPAVGPI